MARENRTCKECQAEIKGRRDKLFCSDYCRASHYNARQTDITPLIRRVNHILRKNRNILYSLGKQKAKRIHKSKLIDSGINLDYFTHTGKNNKGEECYFCYDQGYRILKGGYYKLLIPEQKQNH